MSQARLSRLAEADLDDIWLHIAAESVERADRVIVRLQRTCEMLAANPGAGPRRSEFGPGLRSFPVQKYLVFYRQAEDGIEVARIIGGFRDLDAILGR